MVICFKLSHCPSLTVLTRWETKSIGSLSTQADLNFSYEGIDWEKKA